MDTKLDVNKHLVILQRCIISEVPGRWRNIGIELEFKDNKLNKISAPHTKPDEDRMREMLVEWLRLSQGTGDKLRTVRILVNALKNQSCAPEAKQLEREFQTAGITTVQLESSRENTDRGPPEQDQPNPTTTNKVKFALLTANDTEFKTVRHFFGKTCPGMEEYSYKDEPDLAKVVEFKLDFSIDGREQLGYDLITIGEVQGIHLKCGYKYGTEAAQKAVNYIIDEAEKKGWQLEIIFCTGCCGCSFAKADQNYRGHVLISNRLIDYNQGKYEDDGQVHSEKLYPMNTDWCNWLFKMEEGPNPVKVSKAESILSGDWVMKKKEIADKLRDKQKIVGIEMEGAGIAKGLDAISEPKCKTKLPRGMRPSDFLIVKGVSDNAGPDKNTLQPTWYHGKETKPVDDKKRQEMATLQSTALVCRAIAKHMRN